MIKQTARIFFFTAAFSFMLNSFGLSLARGQTPAGANSDSASGSAKGTQAVANSGRSGETDDQKKTDEDKKKAKKKTTEVSFEDVLVQGKYHFSDEAVTTVEEDKVLDALLGVRTDFKDRLKKSSSRH